MANARTSVRVDKRPSRNSGRPYATIEARAIIVLSKSKNAALIYTIVVGKVPHLGDALKVVLF